MALRLLSIERKIVCTLDAVLNRKFAPSSFLNGDEGGGCEVQISHKLFVVATTVHFVCVCVHGKSKIIYSLGKVAD